MMTRRNLHEPSPQLCTDKKIEMQTRHTHTHTHAHTHARARARKHYSVVESLCPAATVYSTAGNANVQDCFCGSVMSQSEIRLNGEMTQKMHNPLGYSCWLIMTCFCG